MDLWISNRDLLRLIGEIDGITLRSVGEHAVAVFIELGGYEFEVISDTAGNRIDHHITRFGIKEHIQKSDIWNAGRIGTGECGGPV